MAVVLRAASIAEVVASGLVAELDAALVALYPHEAPSTIDVDRFEADGGCFVLAEEDGAPLGCGALRRHDAVSAEVKRLYTRPAARGRGIAAAILAALEAEAARRGLRRLILETGVRQPAAIRLYARSGYAPIARFGEFADNPDSLCFEKAL